MACAQVVTGARTLKVETEGSGGSLAAVGVHFSVKGPDGRVHQGAPSILTLPSLSPPRDSVSVLISFPVLDGGRTRAHFLNPSLPDAACATGIGRTHCEG